jgi:TetR/AcrR family transcriptional regulator
MEEQPATSDGQAPAGPCCEHDEHARERLLRVAAEVFDRKGYAAASVREIVEGAGITKPVLYYHYGSKEGLLLAILEEGARLFDAALARAVESPGTARDRLFALCSGVYDLFKQNVAAVRVAHAVFFGPQDNLPPFDFSRFEGALTGALGSIIEQGIAAGEIREAPVGDLVMVINGLIGVFIDQELTLTPRVNPLGLDGIRRVLDLIFEGLGSGVMT